MAINILSGARDEAHCDNEVGCVPQDVGGGSIINWDGRYGAVWGPLGLLGGLYFPGFENSKSGYWYSMFGGYAQLSLQNEYASIAVGPELSGGMIGVTTGFDLQPWGEEVFYSPNFAAYFRYLRPWLVDPNATADSSDAAVPSWDVGFAVRVAMVRLQYSYYRHTVGVIHYVIYETAVEASAWHNFTFGIDITEALIEAMD